MKKSAGCVCHEKINALLLFFYFSFLAAGAAVNVLFVESHH